MKFRVISVLLILTMILSLLPMNILAAEVEEEQKMILAVGDSICRGYRNGGKGFVADVGLPYVNLGVSGSTLSTVQSRYKTVADILIGANVEADIIIANGGVNDYNQSAPLGEISAEMAEDEDYFTDSVRATVLGGLERLLFEMCRKYPDARKFFLLSHKTAVLGKDGTRTDWTVTKNRAGYTQTELFNAFKKVCRVYGVEIIDVFGKSEIDASDEKYLADYRCGNLGDMTMEEFLEETANDWLDGDGIHPLDYGYLHGYVPMIQAAISREPMEIPFLDVDEDDYFARGVIWAVAMDITKGMSETTFAPDEPCTRGQVVTFLWRACGCPEPSEDENHFEDVDPGDYYYKAVQWAVEENITTGLDKTSFSPNEVCTRGQVATFLWRSQGEPKPESKRSPFSDVKRGDYYRKAVLWAVENGVTQGFDDGTFAPANSCTRAQIVTFLYRALA